MDTGVLAVHTNTPDDDYAIPPDLERLICETCGQEEAGSFFWSSTEGGNYAPSELNWAALRKGMFAAVASQDRVMSIIPSVYRTSQYILDPYCALAYGALSDYRARFGSSRTVLLLSEKSPLSCSEAVSEAMGISVDELKKRISEL
jgi:threonine synthase